MDTFMGIIMRYFPSLAQIDTCLGVAARSIPSLRTLEFTLQDTPEGSPPVIQYHATIDGRLASSRPNISHPVRSIDTDAWDLWWEKGLVVLEKAIMSLDTDGEGESDEASDGEWYEEDIYEGDELSGVD